MACVRAEIWIALAVPKRRSLERENGGPRLQTRLVRDSFADDQRRQHPFPAERGQTNGEGQGARDENHVQIQEFKREAYSFCIRILVLH